MTDHYYGPTIQAAMVHEDAEMGEVYKRLAYVHDVGENLLQLDRTEAIQDEMEAVLL